MRVMLFRPFKRLENEELIYQLYQTFERLKSEERYYQDVLELCNQLIIEAKMRNLCCSKEMLYKKILYE